MVEVDGAVVEICREFLPNHSAGTFDDPRLKLVIDDGMHFLAETEEKFDVIICDATDPVGPGEALFSENFYQACRRCLNEGGILVAQNGTPFLQLGAVQMLAPSLAKFGPLGVKEFELFDLPYIFPGRIDESDESQENQVVICRCFELLFLFLCQCQDPQTCCCHFVILVQPVIPVRV